MKQHGKLFLKKRLDRTKLSGLPLTLLLLSFTYVLALFADLIEDFVNQESIVHFDRQIAENIVHYRTQPLTDLFTWITLLVHPVVAGAFLILLILLLWLQRKSLYTLALLLTVGGAWLFMHLGKLAFARARPETALYYEPTYSFPSGHATMAVALYGFGIWLFTHFMKRRLPRYTAYSAALILILLVGTSRIYLGVHYPSDVYAGWLLGTLWAIVGIATTWALDAKTTPQPPRKSATPLTIIAISLFLGWYLWFGMGYRMILIQ